MSVNLHANEPNIWESPPMRIGKHDWIVAVFEHAMYGRCTRYCFCGPKVPGWYADGVYLPDQDWPTYDGCRRATLLLGEQCRAVDAPDEAERSFWDAL